MDCNAAETKEDEHLVCLDRIRITKRMLDAGAEVITQCHGEEVTFGWIDPHAEARRVFSAMDSARGQRRTEKDPRKTSRANRGFW